MENEDRFYLCAHFQICAGEKSIPMEGNSRNKKTLELI